MPVAMARSYQMTCLVGISRPPDAREPDACSACSGSISKMSLERKPNRFQRMARTHPKQYDYCINRLGLGKVLDYINVKY